MIRINLLPVRAARKKEAAKQQLLLAGVSIAAVLVIILALYSMMLGKISGTKDEISRSENELSELKKKIGEINNIKKLQAEVQKKLDVLNQLRHGKTGPVTRLTTLSEVVPDKLWLTKYVENGDVVSLSGTAVNEDLIAEFMRNLEKSPDFSGVELQVSEQAEVQGMKVKKFDIVCKIEAAKKAEPAPAQPVTK